MNKSHRIAKAALLVLWLVASAACSAKDKDDVDDIRTLSTVVYLCARTASDIAVKSDGPVLLTVKVSAPNWWISARPEPEQDVWKKVSRQIGLPDYPAGEVPVCPAWFTPDVLDKRSKTLGKELQASTRGLLRFRVLGISDPQANLVR